MPTFLPNEPQNGETVDADVLRNQFNSLKDLIDAEPSGALLQRHEYEFYADAIPAPSGTIGHVTGSHGMLKIADGITCWRDIPYLGQTAPGAYPAAYAVTGCGDPSYNGIYHYRGVEPNGGTPYPSYELSSHRVLVFKSSAVAPDGWQIGQHNDQYPRYFVSSGGDAADPAIGVWSDDGVLGPCGQIRPCIGTGTMAGLVLADGANGLRAAIPGTDYVATLAGVAVSSFANDAGYSTAAYTPATAGNWVDPVPTTLAEAIDRLAAAVSGNGTTPVG